MEKSGTSAFVKLREDERDARRALIVDAAKKLFSQKSFHEIGMRDIAVFLGVSPASIYRYFRSQDDLFVELLFQDMSEIEKVIDNSFRMDRISLEDVAKTIIDYLLDNEATFQIMCHFMVKGEIDDKTLKKYNAVQEFFLHLFDSAFEKAGTPVDNRLFFHAFFASIAGVVMSFRNYKRYNKKQAREHMYNLASLIAESFGLSVDKTAKEIKKKEVLAKKRKKLKK
jgi:AcrR family transcriptional regulator